MAREQSVMSGFQQDPGELTSDAMYARSARELDASLVEENDGDESGPAHDELEPRGELRTRFRQSIEIIKQARRITELECQVANLYERLGWKPAK